jgi:hypothetical protein
MASERFAPERVGDVIGLPMADSDGRDLGKVYDIQLRRDGPVLPEFGRALRVEALLVGRESLATRLGFARPEMTGPWPIDRWGRRALRRTRVVPWECVRRDGEALQCTRRVDELECAGQ